jgi:hypothetical protein
MVWNKKKPIEENPISAEDLKRYNIPEIPEYKESPKEIPRKMKENKEKWELVEVPTQVQIAFRNNETGEDLSLHQAVCRILQIIDSE